MKPVLGDSSQCIDKYWANNEKRSKEDLGDKEEGERVVATVTAATELTAGC